MNRQMTLHKLRHLIDNANKMNPIERKLTNIYENYIELMLRLDDIDMAVMLAYSWEKGFPPQIAFHFHKKHYGTYDIVQKKTGKYKITSECLQQFLDAKDDVDYMAWKLTWI